MASTGTTVATPSNISSSKYKVGDIVWKEPTIYNSVVAADMGVVILSADPGEQNYTIDYIFRDSNTTTWYRLYPDPKVDPMSIDDELYPYLVGTVEISAIVTKYPSKDAFAAQMGTPPS